MNNTLYKKRRIALCRALPEDSALMLPAWPKAPYSLYIEHPYKAFSDIIYLSGFEEADSCLLLLSGGEGKYFLFTQKKDLVKEIWTGPVFGPQKAKKVFKADACYPIEEFFQIAEDLLNNVRFLYYPLGINPHFDPQVKKLWRKLINKTKEKLKHSKLLSLRRAKEHLQNPLKLIASLRKKKDPEEIKLISKAVLISGQAHIEVMKNTKPGLNEKALYGIFLREIMKRGAEKQAYPGIFASGSNACTLHYTKNNKTLKKGDLILVDAGAEFKHYASDITRTFPVSGKFSKTQKRLYEKVLKVQKSLIRFLKPGLFFSEIQKKTVELLSVLMREEGFLSGSVEQIIKQKKYKKYFPHGFGHLLGLDVHDPQDEKDVQIQEGVILTIEPGLYLPEKDLSLKPKFRGLGIRIEDDILITKKGAKVLSIKVPKETEQIEALMAKA